MEKIVIAICLLLSCTSLMSQNKKEVKALLKSLKKEYGLSHSDYRKSQNDDYVYIYLRTKDGYSMIADSLGNLIIPNTYPSHEYYTKIEYTPSHKREYGKKRKHNSPMDYFYVGNQRCFVAKEKSGIYYFYNQKGMKLSEFSGVLQESLEADTYIATSIPKDGGEISSSTNNIGLLAKDGTVLIPTDYSEINATSTGLCYVSKKENDVTKQGVINIGDTPRVNVPCLFNKVVSSENNNAWLVKMHELDTLSVYSPDCVYSCSYIDEGERLYESGHYEETRKYYSIEHSNVPWANAYLGACGWKAAVSNYKTAEQALKKLGTTTAANGHDIANTVYKQLDLFEKESKQALKHFDSYLQGKDKKYKPRIKEIKYDLVKLTDNADVLRKSVEHELDAYKHRREAYLEEERLKQIKKENERALRQEQQRIENQRLHEINERNRIALERQKAKRREEEKRKAEQKQTDGKPNSSSNRSVPKSQQNIKQ